jgi:hypothetical protein
LAVTAALSKGDHGARHFMSGTYGISIFCEDVRMEASDQRTLVGVYTDDLIVGGFPAVLPRLGIYITLIEPLPEAEGPMNIKVTIPGEHGEEVIVDTDLPNDRKSDAIGAESDPEYLINTLAFRLSPLLIEREGRIKVRGFKNNEKIRLGTIYVTEKRS